MKTFSKSNSPTLFLCIFFYCFNVFCLVLKERSAKFGARLCWVDNKLMKLGRGHLKPLAVLTWKCSLVCVLEGGTCLTCGKVDHIYTFGIK